MTQSWRPDDWADDNDAWRGELHRDADDRWRGLEHIADWPEAQAGPEEWMYKLAPEESLAIPSAGGQAAEGGNKTGKLPRAFTVALLTARPNPALPGLPLTAIPRP